MSFNSTWFFKQKEMLEVFYLKNTVGFSFSASLLFEHVIEKSWVTLEVYEIIL